MGYDLQEIADRMEINDLLTTYAHAIDLGDFDKLDDLVLPDAVFDLTSAGVMHATWPEVRRFYGEMRPVFEHFFHLYGNVLIAFAADRHSASVMSKVINPIGVRDAEGTLRLFIVDGSYEDIFVKTARGWRIKARTWHHGAAIGDVPPEQFGGLKVGGSTTQEPALP